MENARREPRVVDLLPLVEEDSALEKPPAPFDPAEKALDVLADALPPPAPSVFLEGVVCLDRWDEQRDL